MFGRTFYGCLLISAAVASPSVGSEVYVVDSRGGGGDFSDLSEAIRSVPSGSTLLVKNGNYLVWDTVGQSLTIIGEGNETYLEGELRIEGLPANESVCLRSVNFRWPANIQLTNNQGVVWVEDSNIHADIYSGPGPYGAIHSVDSRLNIMRSTISGSLPYGEYDAPPTAGIHATDSEIFVSEGSIVGGSGDAGTLYDDHPGAEAIFLQNSLLVTSRVTIVGGEGEELGGGTGILGSDGSTVCLRETTVLGGSGTMAGDSLQLDGTSRRLDLTGSIPSLATDSPRQVGEQVSIQVNGDPGQPIWLAVSLAPDQVISPSGEKVVAFSASAFALLPLGATNPDGSLVSVFGVLDLVGCELPLTLQAIGWNSSLGRFQYGGASELLLVDLAN